MLPARSPETAGRVTPLTGAAGRGGLAPPGPHHLLILTYELTWPIEYARNTS